MTTINDIIKNTKPTRTFIIAEIGKNFIDTKEEQSVAVYLENAKALAVAAHAAGADAVKFQTHNVEDEQKNIDVTSPHFTGSDRYSWVARNTSATPFDEFWKPLKSFCDDMGIVFFTTPMSRGAAQKVLFLKPDLWKVGSGDILDFVMLDFLASTGRPIIISSGMSTIEELDQVVSFLQKRNTPLVLMHCVSRYPCPPEDLRLATMATLRERYTIPVGFSDHSLGHDSAVAAVALGASVIEKHFSFSRDAWGADHKVSMTPEEFKKMVVRIREIEASDTLKKEVLRDPEVQKSIGTEEKNLQPEEAIFRPYFRKSLVAGQDIAEGSMITKEMLYAMRPQAYIDGLPSERYEIVVGKKTNRNIKRFEAITQGCIV